MLDDSDCGAGMVQTDVGWTVGLYLCGDAAIDENPQTCSLVEHGVASQATTITLTRAAVAMIGPVPIATGPQSADQPSVAISFQGTAVTAGTFTLTAVASSLSATFEAGSGNAEVDGSIMSAPYCP